MQSEKDLISGYSSRAGKACLVILLCLISVSCKPEPASVSGKSDEAENFVLTKRRDDGILSSMNQVDDNGSALPQHFVKPGNTLHKKIGIIAEIPTELGNIMMRDFGYDHAIINSYKAYFLTFNL